MTKILNVNDLCDAIVSSSLDESRQRALIDNLETAMASVAKAADYYWTVSNHAECKKGFGG